MLLLVMILGHFIHANIKVELVSTILIQLQCFLFFFFNTYIDILLYFNAENYKDAKTKLEKLKTSSYVHSSIESEDDDAEVRAKFVQEIKQKQFREEFEKQRKSLQETPVDLKRKTESTSSKKSSKKSKLSNKHGDSRMKS